MVMTETLRKFLNNKIKIIIDLPVDLEINKLLNLRNS